MRIAVLFGGKNEERDVSIASAAGIVPALRSVGHDVVAVDTAAGFLSIDEEARVLRNDVPLSAPSAEATYPRGDLVAALAGRLAEVDLVFLALHGGEGENGTMQAYLSLLGLPYTGSDATGSALAMDKELSKRLFRAGGIPTPDWLFNPASPAAAVRHLGSPLIIKPNAQGSTVGLTLARDVQEAEEGFELANRYGDVLIERFIAGRELTVGVLDGRPLAVGEIVIPASSAFSYAEKYQPGAVLEVFPADLDKETTRRAQHLAAQAHQVLKLRGYSRADFRLDPDGELWLIEVNTLPGMTSTSLLPQSAQACGISYSDLCSRICSLALSGARALQ